MLLLYLQSAFVFSSDTYLPSTLLRCW